MMNSDVIESFCCKQSYSNEDEIIEFMKNTRVILEIFMLREWRKYSDDEEVIELSQTKNTKKIFVTKLLDVIFDVIEISVEIRNKITFDMWRNTWD